MDLWNSPKKGGSSAAKEAGGTNPAGVEGEVSKASSVDIKETSAETAVDAELAVDTANEETAGKGAGPSPK